ncbi:MAG: nucleotidyltransferase family protein, partial [Deltaproteobacteria bacterium]|nr:nucleotidyltransferase family protein [Deltaproteobacteria bacterium]
MLSRQETVRFIRCISKTHLSQADMDHMLHFLKKDVPWDYLGALAEMEGIAGLLYYRLKTSDLVDYLPKSFIGRLENTYRQTKKHTLAILAKAEALSSSFEEAGISVLALQGLSLVKVYGDPGLRPLGDADLMVKPCHKGKLKRLLYEAEYRMPSFMYPDLLCQDGIWVDIHTHILNLERIRSRQYLFPEDLAPMWVRAIPFFDKSGGLLLLDPYDNFIALAAHALKHSYSRLIWLVDLYESLLKWAGNTGGWEGMIERAYFWRQEKVVLYALILMERIFDLKVPLWVKDYLGIRKLNILEKQVIRMKFKGFSSGELCYVLWLFNIKGIKRK